MISQSNINRPASSLPNREEVFSPRIGVPPHSIWEKPIATGWALVERAIVPPPSRPPPPSACAPTVEGYTSYDWSSRDIPH